VGDVATGFLQDFSSLALMQRQGRQ